MSGDSSKGKVEPKKVSSTPDDKQKTCFVIMPIADHSDYPAGHFGRVYEYIIKPACIKAGFAPDRADDAQHTHVIMMNILQRILNADMALCDLSSRNPNVMYELGIMQAFDKPVTLIKDDKTTRVFDTGMLSDVEYFSDLRIDNVNGAIDAIATRLQNTYDKKNEQVNSLIQLMKIQPATSPDPTVISPETNVVLEAIGVLGRRISALESPRGLERRPRSDVNMGFLQQERDALLSKAAVLATELASLRAKLESIDKGPEGIDHSTRCNIVGDLGTKEIELNYVQNAIQNINNRMSQAYVRVTTVG